VWSTAALEPELELMQVVLAGEGEAALNRGVLLSRHEARAYSGFSMVGERARRAGETIVTTPQNNPRNGTANALFPIN